MVPAPARTAAPPRARSRASWNPAVPPPPVAGATTGTGLGEGLGDGLGSTDCDGLADGLADGLSDALADGLALWLAVALAVPLVGVGEELAPGDNGGSPAEDEVPKQAETVAETSMVMTP